MKKLILVIFFLVLGNVVTSAQTETTDSSDVFTVVNEMPEFPGGEAAFNSYLDKNLTYPKKAIRNNIQGKVWLSFLVDKEGNISNVTLLKGIGGGCDEEAIRVIQQMPKWNPGKQDGKPVVVKYRFPINFTLR